MKLRFLLTLLSSIALSSTIARAEGTWYMDFGIGSGKAEGIRVPVTGTTSASSGNITSFSFSQPSGRDTTLTARIGARVLPWLAIEASYFHLGDYPYQTSAITSQDAAGVFQGSVVTVDARARSGGLAVVGILPLATVDLYARAGYARTELKTDTTQGLTQITVDERFNEAYYGAGARWNVTRELGLFAEYHRQDKLGLDAYFAGMQWRF
jgi:hypothetical protein